MILNERSVIRYLTLGLKNEQVESIILAAKPRTFFETVKEWEAFVGDRRQGHPVHVNDPLGGLAPLSPLVHRQEPSVDERIDLLNN